MIFISCRNDNETIFTDKTNSEHVESMINSDHKNQFIIEPDSMNGRWVEIEESNSRQRKVSINPFFISMDSSGVGQNIHFNIYEEESLVGEVNRVSRELTGEKAISGLLLEDKGGFVFTITDSLLLGQLRLTDRDKIIQIRSGDGLNEYILTESNRSDLDVIPGSAPMRRGNN